MKSSWLLGSLGDGLLDSLDPFMMASWLLGQGLLGSLSEGLLGSLAKVFLDSLAPLPRASWILW